jgi:hypothetical protein
MTYDTEEATIRAPIPLARISSDRGAQLDAAHVGDIRGGFGTIREHDVGCSSAYSTSIKRWCCAWEPLTHAKSMLISPPHLAIGPLVAFTDGWE